MLNLLWQSNSRPAVSAFALLAGPFNYNKMPLAPMGCEVQVHKKRINVVMGLPLLWWLVSVHVTQALPGAQLSYQIHQERILNRHHPIPTQEHHQSIPQPIWQTHECHCWLQGGTTQHYMALQHTTPISNSKVSKRWCNMQKYIYDSQIHRQRYPFQGCKHSQQCRKKSWSHQFQGCRQSWYNWHGVNHNYKQDSAHTGTV